MPVFARDDISLHYEVAGDGFPILLIAPGGMRSTAERWNSVPWNPIDALAADYRVIAMDQRNAGRSKAPVAAGDGWHSYTADQLALLDHLGVEQCHVIGMCIGGPYILGLIKAAPERIRSAVMFQPIGLEHNRDAFEALFDGWAEELAADHPAVDAETWAAFKQAMFGGEFMFNTSQDELAGIETPILLLMGDDLYHPQSTSRAIAASVPNVSFIEQWKEEPHRAEADRRIREFLAATSPP